MDMGLCLLTIHPYRNVCGIVYAIEKAIKNCAQFSIQQLVYIQMNYENYGKLYTSIHISKHCMAWNLILQLVAEPKIKVRKLDGNLLVRTIAMRHWV